MTTNIVGALAVLVLLFIEDWRMGLSMFIVLPLGILCFMSMFSGYNEKFQRTVTATKTLTTRLWNTSAALRSSRRLVSPGPAMQSSSPPQKRARTASSTGCAGVCSDRWPNGDTPFDTSRHLAGGLPSLYARHTVGGDVSRGHCSVLRRYAAADHRFFLHR